ncbi:MAG: hypothetical protein COX20_05845 [Desulfobacterales bacterium CG23_combo_of_CG06-09_8_20_14_all_52_9]|nr:MAG: hypothetical protein COX20_05845 [Desulfobacterales bacterium CG23_combo_of_CG06-09_8_20_14_all_52_9]
MAHPFKPVDFKRIRTYSLIERNSKVETEQFARTYSKGSTFSAFFSSLPDMLAGKEIREVVAAVSGAATQGKTVLFGMGAHVIKVGLNPIVIDLMERGVISAVATNGAGIIHDLEVAMAGKTSEDVGVSLSNGTFGMVRETGDFLNRVVREKSGGLGQRVGEAILTERLPYRDLSILATGARLKIPVTVHVAFGTDIVHMHPAFDPERTGRATYTDFETFVAVMATLEGGVYLNVGSAVILPEVFLKALAIVRNLGYPVKRFTTVNMDFIRHYRPMTNVVVRPTADGGRGYALVGHHEIMLPLLAAGIIEALGS